MAYRAFVADETARIQEHGTYVKRRLFESEGVDPVWAAQIQPRIVRKLAEDKPFGDSKLESLECHVTVCQVVLYNPSETMQQTNGHSVNGIPGMLMWNMEQSLDQGLNPDHTGYRATLWLSDDFEEGPLRRVAGQVQIVNVQTGKIPDGKKP